MQESQFEDGVELLREHVETTMLKLIDAIDAEIGRRYSSVDDINRMDLVEAMAASPSSWGPEAQAAKRIARKETPVARVLRQKPSDLKEKLEPLLRPKSAALKALGLGREARISRDEKLKQLALARDAACGVLDIVRDPETTSATLSALESMSRAFGYAALPLLIPKTAQLEGNVKGGHKKIANEHQQHGEWKEDAVARHRRDPRRYASMQRTAEAIAADDVITDPSADEKRTIQRVPKVLRGLKCRECDDPPGFADVRRLWGNLSKGSGSFRPPATASGPGKRTKAAKGR